MDYDQCQYVPRTRTELRLARTVRIDNVRLIMSEERRRIHEEIQRRWTVREILEREA